MMLAIHESSAGFHPRWAAYCQERAIPFRLVDCYRSDLIQQLRGCDGLLWHHGHSSVPDILIARKVLFALEQAGLKVFPNFRTAWHFDDKIAQKYLFEAAGLPLVPAYSFVRKEDALSWAEQAEFPKVFKLRHGAGSTGVRLVRDQCSARRLISRAFGRGFPLYDPLGSLVERAYKVRRGLLRYRSLANGIARLVWPPRFSTIVGRQRDCIYFQDFVPGNTWDTRVIVIGRRAFAIRRLVRPGDFRASGSGLIEYARELFDLSCVELAFTAADTIGSDCAALDFVQDESGTWRILEISFGFAAEGYDACSGYWDRDLVWHAGPFNPQGWIIEELIGQCG